MKRSPRRKFEMKQPSLLYSPYRWVEQKWRFLTIHRPCWNIALHECHVKSLRGCPRRVIGAIHELRWRNHGCCRRCAQPGRAHWYIFRRFANCVSSWIKPRCFGHRDSGVVDILWCTGAAGAFAWRCVDISVSIVLERASFRFLQWLRLAVIYVTGIKNTKCFVPY